MAKSELDRVKSELRVCRAMAATSLLIAAFMGMVAIGAAPPEVPAEVRSRAFVLVDEKGVELARLAPVGGAGNSSLRFLRDGKARVVEVGTDVGAPFLTMNGKDDSGAITMKIDGVGACSLSLDAKEEAPATIACNADMGDAKISWHAKFRSGQLPAPPPSPSIYK